MSDDSDPRPSTDAAPIDARIADDRDLRASMRRVAVACSHLLPHSAAVSVTIIERGRPMTVSSTSDVALAIDLAQYEADDGPCLRAARQGRLVPVVDVEADDRWPTFRTAALACGVRSSMSLPLSLGADVQGGINVYGADPHAFDADDTPTTAAFTARASVAVANAWAYWSAREAARNLALALENRAVIEQAKGVLITRYGYGDDEAFAALRRSSQRENRKLRDVAADVVERARRGLDDDH